VLRSLVVALEKHIAFAEQNDMQVERKFSELLIRLISNRPSVFAAAMDSYSDLRSLSVRVLHSIFTENVKRTDDAVESMPVVAIKLFKTRVHEGGMVELPLTLLQSMCVVLSIWKDGGSEDEIDVVSAIEDFATALLRPDSDDHADVDTGLASAKVRDDGVVEAVPVESVSSF